MKRRRQECRQHGSRPGVLGMGGEVGLGGDQLEVADVAERAFELVGDAVEGDGAGGDAVPLRELMCPVWTSGGVWRSQFSWIR